MTGSLDDLKGNLGSHAEGLPDEVLQGFLGILESVRLQEMPCTEVYAKLDEYVERELRDHEAAKLMPLLKEHLDLCHDCCEEYEALLSALEESSSQRPPGDEAPDARS
jgi:hypothetical protein